MQKDFDDLVRGCRRDAVRYACTIAVTLDEAEDLVQDALIHAWLHFQVYDPERGPFLEWLKALMRQKYSEGQNIPGLRAAGKDDLDSEDVAEHLGRVVDRVFLN